MATKKSVSRFLNREIQLLAFNHRVLAQAEDKTVPLLERLKYLSIVSSNLDEFFEIRVAGLKEQIKLNSTTRGADGRSAKETLRLVVAEVNAMVVRQYALLNDEMFPAMAAEGIRFVRRANWTPAQQAWVRSPRGPRTGTDSERARRDRGAIGALEFLYEVVGQG